MPDVHEGEEALAHVERALEDRPIRDGDTLRSAVRCLAAYRDHAVERHRRQPDGGGRGALERINAVMSVVMAAQFPLGEVRWEELGRARGWLADILRDEAEAQRARG